MISGLLATTGRPLMAEAAVRSFLETTKHHPVQVVAAVDNDRETVRRLSNLAPVSVEVNWSAEYRGCSRAWNDALAQSSGDPLVLMADDLVFSPGWLDAALAELARFPDGWGMVGLNDGHFDGQFATHYLMSRRFVREVLGGVVAWECYRHSFNDVEVSERAKAAGRFSWCEDARVTHNHWIWGTREQDLTDQRALPLHHQSQYAYLARRDAGFPNDHEAVI
jgi:GT2 family glycosyltransferase